MRGGDEVGSRMRVAAASCLVSSGLFVGGACGAVALAEPDSGGDASGAGTAGRTSNETAGQPRRTAPRGVSTGTGAGSAAPGLRSAAAPAGTEDPPVFPAEPVEPDDSKLPETGTDAGAAQPDDAAGEQDGSPPAAGADEGKEEDEDDEDDECGWWPLPPEGVSSAPNGGDGYGGGAPSTDQPGRPGAPPGMEIPPPESPVVPDALGSLPGPVAPAAVPMMSLPVIVLPPVLPGIGAGGGAGPRGPADKSATRPPVPARTAPAERPAAPRTDDNVVPASYRAGYGEYLRTAEMTQVIAVAVPGATGIMLLTGAGGLIGYRQARAGHAIRASGSARFSS